MITMQKQFSILFLLILLALIGCSGTENSPVTLLVGVSEKGSNGNPVEGYGILGLFDVYVNTKTLEGEIVSVRSSTSTDTLEIVDISNFLSMAPCTDCVKLKSIELDLENNLVLEIGVKHPFAAGDPLKPISGRNRADLHVFNVEGTVFSQSGSFLVFSGLGQSVADMDFVNADGYSAYLKNPIDPFSLISLNPYKLHFDDYGIGNFRSSNPMGFASVTDPPPSGNLVMAMGSDYDFQQYKFRFPAGELFEFTLSIGCTYAVSAESKSLRFAPEYRMPQHNKKAASEVKIEIVDNQLSAGDSGSFVDIEVRVVDINHGVAMGSGLDEMEHDSSVSEIKIDIPGVTITPVLIDVSAPTGSGHNPMDPLVFSGTVYNTSMGTEGTYKGLVKVLDSYLPSSNISPLLDGMDAIERVDPGVDPLTGLYSIAEFATYQVFDITIQDNDFDCIIETTPNPPTVIQGETITFDGSLSIGLNPIVSYEWDFDYDGISFDVDDSGAVVVYRTCDTGSRDAALRLTDNILNSTICSVEITVNSDTSPIGGWVADIRAGGSLGGVQNGVNTKNMGMRNIAIYGDDLYVAYEDWGGNIGPSPTLVSQQIWLARSSDLGSTWNTDDVQVTNNNPSDLAITKYPSICVDQSNGDIYVAYVSNGSNGGALDYEFMITRSTDGGANFAAEVQVNPDPGPSAGTYAWPCVAIDDSLDPSRIYVSYNNDTIGNDWNIHVATTTSDNFTSWTDRVVDDSSVFPFHHCIAVNPVDNSVNVVWGDGFIDSLGTNNLLFDRSTDYGNSWGTDVIIDDDPAVNVGPDNPALAINPNSGVPGVLFTSSEGYFPGDVQWHKFVKADSVSGSSWGTPIVLDTQTRPYLLRHGSLDVSPDGHWAAVTWSNWEVLFMESQDDGVTWTTGVDVVNNTGFSVYEPNMIMDDCKNVYVCWTDSRDSGSLLTTELYFDWGS